MVRTGHLSPRLADAFKAQAGGLLATMLSENNRSFLGSGAQSTIERQRRFGCDRMSELTVCEHGTPPGSNCCARSENWTG
jgi:hypothetical protein